MRLDGEGLGNGEGAFGGTGWGRGLGETAPRTTAAPHGDGTGTGVGEFDYSGNGDGFGNDAPPRMETDFDVDENTAIHCEARILLEAMI